MKAPAIVTLVYFIKHRRREATSSDAVLPKRRPNFTHMTATAAIAEAIHELELYDDTDEAHVVRALLAAVLDVDAGDASDVD